MIEKLSTQSAKVRAKVCWQLAVTEDAWREGSVRVGVWCVLRLAVSLDRPQCLHAQRKWNMETCYV